MKDKYIFLFFVIFFLSLLSIKVMAPEDFGGPPPGDVGGGLPAPGAVGDTAVATCTGDCVIGSCGEYNDCFPSESGTCPMLSSCCSGTCTMPGFTTTTPPSTTTASAEGTVPLDVTESTLSGVEICNIQYRCGLSDGICPDHFFPIQFRCFEYDYDCDFPQSCVRIDGTCTSTSECSGRVDPDCERALPDWCNNNERDMAYDETGIDCGGACPNCGTTSPVCGNGNLDRLEECDSVDGCSSRCTWITTITTAADRFSLRTLPDGSVPIPSGSLLLPDGSILLPDRRILFPGGTAIPLDPREPTPTGGRPIPDGSILLSDGRILLPDGNILLRDGRVVSPEGGAPSLTSPAEPGGPSIGDSIPPGGLPPGGISSCEENIEITSFCTCGSSPISSGYCCAGRSQILSCSECPITNDGVEICDGLNNDCDNLLDEGNLCGTEVCISGSCQPRAACTPTNEGIECCGDNIDNDCRNGIDNICDRDNDGYVDCDAPICPGMVVKTCREFEEEPEEREIEIFASFCNTICERSSRFCHIMNRVRLCAPTGLIPTPTETAPTPVTQPTPTPTPATGEETAPPPPIAPGSIG